MRRLIASCLVFVFVLPCHAQGDKPRPNTLTPKEIADGWILLFDGETTFGWNLEGDVKVEQGFLRLQGAKDKTARLSLNSLLPEEIEITAEVTRAKYVLRETTPTIGELDLGISSFPSGKPETGRGTFRLVCQVEGDLRKEEFYPPGQAEPNVSRTRPRMGRPTRLSFSAPNAVEIRNIKLRPLNTKSLFNGKDLTGWREFPGKKSKFAVIDNAINVKDGPGDLQTVGKYQDFVLQLECISNGKHLNSGIFFRCRDNEYQNGYEAQIRNQFTPEATQKYLIEEYDPKTNKVTAKKEIMSTAFDFGTGAIYRRVPARKQMSKDGEWFGMTIIARGNHLATWVNGVQVTDWYDNRPKSDNARTGCKLDAGHISIQGHDPTTDLSFRNFRIAEWSAAK